MYRVLEALREPGESNEALAERLGIEINRRSDGRPDQTDLSRTFSDRGFARIAAGLRAWAMEHPEQWLQMLASGKDAALWDEFADLLFLTERFWAVAHNTLRSMAEQGAAAPASGDDDIMHRLSNELWVITSDPAELDNAREREFSALRMRQGQRIVYWLPTTGGLDLARRVYTEFSFTGLVPEDAMNERLFFVLGPDVMGELLPLAINDPHGEGVLGVTGSRHETGNVRVTVVPQQITNRAARWMRGIYMDLLRNSELTTEDGCRWRLVRGREVHEKKA
jgi:hypothetical protein